MSHVAVEHVPSTVLLAEDDDDLRAALREVLEAAGYDVLVAADGGSALRVAAGRRLAAAIVDLHLPGTGGGRVVEELLRRDPRLCAIVMSGDSAARAPAGAMMLMKPFAIETLLEAVEPPARGRVAR